MSREVPRSSHVATGSTRVAPVFYLRLTTRSLRDGIVHGMWTIQSLSLASIVYKYLYAIVVHVFITNRYDRTQVLGVQSK